MRKYGRIGASYRLWGLIPCIHIRLSFLLIGTIKVHVNKRHQEFQTLKLTLSLALSIKGHAIICTHARGM